MFTSSADVFRTRQSVQDLLEVVRLHRAAMFRQGTTGADHAEIEAIVAGGCVIPPDGLRAYAHLLEAAAMPDDDFNSFVSATAVLIADRLQQGAGNDDLYWNFEAFEDHYLLADPPVRAALMNGFRIGARQGLLKLPRAPDFLTCLTRQQTDVEQLLHSAKSNVLLEAVTTGVSAKVAGQLWAHDARKALTWPDRVGFRFLYERATSMAPDDGKKTELIPWT